MSHLPCLRACTKCLERNIKCTKCLVLTWSVDCESGNRKMADICGSEENPSLTYLVVVTDAVHLGKTYKCSWGNWFLILGEGDRSSLATLRMLRNDSDHVVSEKLHKLLTTESVRNKDRMAVEPLLELTNQELLDFLKSKGTIFLTMNILPDRYRIKDSNKEDFTTIPLLFAPLAREIFSFSTGIQRPADHILSSYAFTAQPRLLYQRGALKRPTLACAT